MSGTAPSLTSKTNKAYLQGPISFILLDGEDRMSDKAENAKAFGDILMQAWEHTPSFICSNEDYIYCLFPADETNERWIEASITFPDGSLEKKEIDSSKAIALLVEELKVLPTYGVESIVSTKAKLDEALARLSTLK